MRHWLVFLAAVCLPVDALTWADDLTGEDVEKVVEYLNAGIKQSKNGKLKKEFKELLTLLEKPDSKEKVDLRAFPLIDPAQPIEGQIGGMGSHLHYNPFGIMTGTYKAKYKVAQVISANEMLVSVGSTHSDVGESKFTLKLCVSTKGAVDGQEIKGVPPGVFIVTGTETYRTAIGGSNTVWVLKPFDIEEAAAVLKEARANPKRPAGGKATKKPAAKAEAKDEKKPAAKAPAKP